MKNETIRTLEHEIKYSESNALYLARACNLSYCSEEEISNIIDNNNYNFEGFISISKKHDIDTQCFVMSDSNNIIVVFRGSNSPKDWLGNFQAVLDPGPLTNTKAHEGFQDALFPAIIKLTNCIDKANPKNKKIWVTGHSLGGALASLYSGMLAENGYKVYGLYTFASPRPGNQNFCNELNNKIEGPHYRVVNKGDLVPHVPPEPFFSHAGKRIILDSEDRDDSENSWLQQRINAVKKFVDKTVDIFDVVDNHLLDGDSDSYLPRLLADYKRLSK